MFCLFVIVCKDAWPTVVKCSVQITKRHWKAPKLHWKMWQQTSMDILLFSKVWALVFSVECTQLAAMSVSWLVNWTVCQSFSSNSIFLRLQAGLTLLLLPKGLVRNFHHTKDSPVGPACHWGHRKSWIRTGYF